MFLTRWVILLFLQVIFLQTTTSTVSEGTSDENPSAISLIQTNQISFYLELISLVYDSCDLDGEKTPDIRLACGHLTNATQALRTFLAPLSDILPTGDQVKMLQLKSGVKSLNQQKAPPAPKIYGKIVKALQKMRKLVPGDYQGDELIISLFAKEESGLDLLRHGSPLDLSAVMVLNVLTQARFLRKETSDHMRWLKMLMLFSLVPQALVLILMVYNYARIQKHARASKKRLHRAARDTELLDRLQSRMGQDIAIAN